MSFWPCASRPQPSHIPPDFQAENPNQGIDEARIEHDESMATAGNGANTPRMEGFMEVSASSNIVKAI